MTALLIALALDAGVAAAEAARQPPPIPGTTGTLALDGMVDNANDGALPRVRGAS